MSNILLIDKAMWKICCYVDNLLVCSCPTFFAHCPKMCNQCFKTTIFSHIEVFRLFRIGQRDAWLACIDAFTVVTVFQIKFLCTFWSKKSVAKNVRHFFLSWFIFHGNLLFSSAYTMFFVATNSKTLVLYLVNLIYGYFQVLLYFVQYLEHPEGLSYLTRTRWHMPSPRPSCLLPGNKVGKKAHHTVF
jgi:hypothetical protein